MHITFLDVQPEDEAVVRAKYPDASIEHAVSPDDIAARCVESDVISGFITTPFPRSLVERLPKLRLLITRSVGFDHIDLDACAEHGITVCNVPDYGSHVIAEHVFALLLARLRNISEGDARVASGQFDYRGLRGMALRGKTIGIVGTGKIGRRVAQIARGFGMHIRATDQCRVMELTEVLGVKYLPLEELLAVSDIVTLHVPATKDTEHFINAERISRMKDGVVLVNTARGSLIDSKALLAALNAGKVRYALLDVLEHEQNFAESKELIEHPHAIVTPHIGFYADDSMRNMYEDCFLSIEQWARGEKPEHVVHPIMKVCDLPGIGHAAAG